MASRIKISKFFLLIFLFHDTFQGIIQPDDVLPLEISPSYENEIGIKGTKFIFRFYIPNNLDKNNMPTVRGYGGSNGQYIGIRFNANTFSTAISHSCLITQIDDNYDIKLTPIGPNNIDLNTIYCKIISTDNIHIISPGKNYKFTITLNSGIIFQNLISITIFISSSNKNDADIFDIGTFNHINIFPGHNYINPQNPIADLNPILSSLNVEVESDINFDVKITFNEWFSWDDYIICLNLPKNQINTESPSLILDKPSPTSNIEIPAGNFNAISLESNEERKYIGFYLDGSLIENSQNDILLMKFSGFKTKEAGLINDDDSQNNNFIGIEIRYRNSYVICASNKINFSISLGNVKFSVKHPETNINDNYRFDVFRGGAFQIEFTISTEKNVNNKYILIKQKDSKKFQRVTFIASSCDFSNFNISSSNFNEIPKCYPIKNKNNLDSSEDNNNGIFFYYPYIMKANTNYKLKVWMFFDECGPEDSETYTDDRTKVEINFYLEMYNNINKNQIEENRIDSKYIFLNKIATERGIICYNTYMGDKYYHNGYLFNMNSYSIEDKLLYREYFNWNIYKHNGQSSNINEDGNKILADLFSVDSKDNSKPNPKFIYSNKAENKLEQGNHLLFVNKITLDSGNNEKLGQFFPMGLFITNIGEKIGAIKGKFFIKLSKNFFAQNLNSNKESEQCYVSWSFGSPSITDNLNWKPSAKSSPKQKYNFITNSEKFFKDDSTALFNPQINNINDYSLESNINEGWDENNNKAEWAFGDDETLKDQISDDSPVDIYFGFADTCHYWTKLDQTITSLYTPIEIIIGITGESIDYSRVMRFIKLFPEGGVWHDNTISEGDDIFIRSNDFIIKNHFAYNKEPSNTDENEEDKGVCLVEILNGILDSREALSSNFFLWIFMGSLLDTDYDQISSTYPVGNLPNTAKAYGFSSQHSLHPNNFYTKPSEAQNSDINTPIYNLATSMNSLYQSATSGYLFYLGSLIVFYNKIKTNSYYELPNDPLVIPYYCPYYHSQGLEDPFSLGIFPSFIAGFGSFESMVNFGNKGFEKLVAKKINNKQLNVIMLSTNKIVHDKNNNLKHFYNTVKFINNYDSNMMTLDVWNSNENEPCNNEYDSIDSFIFFFYEKITEINNINPQAYIPSQLKSLSKSNKGNYCFYVYGKKFCSGLYGITNSDLLLTRNTPNSRDKTPYLSINLKFEISQSLLKCESSDKFCPTDIIAFWGISSNHDMPNYVTNYKQDSFILDYNIYRTYINNNPPTFELGQTMVFKNDPAIFIKLTFNSPFKTAILSNTILSFNIKDIIDEECSVQSYDVDLPSIGCNNDNGNIQCTLLDSSMKYNIFCYKINFGPAGKFTFYNFKLNLPSENSYTDIGTLIFEDDNEYPIILVNSNDNPSTPIIQANYITNPYNSNSYSKLELIVNLQRPAHPGMEIEIIFKVFASYNNPFEAGTECKFSLSRINTYSLDDIDIDEYWTKGNSMIYKCSITLDLSDGTTKYIIKAKLEDILYKVEKELSSYAYIYIWPFKTIFLDDKYVYLSVTVNNNYILSADSTDEKIFFSSINQIIDNTECIFKNDLISEISFSSNILGDISDYTFKFDFTNLVFTATSPSISMVQIFFSKEISFECEECVKCYEISNFGQTMMITCNFEDYNILNIFFNSIINSQREISIIITGIINPRIETYSCNIFLNLVYINSAGNRYSIFSSKYNIVPTNFISNPKIGGLRFFYVNQATSDNNPRKKAVYSFRVGFDYANNNYMASTLPTLSQDSLLYIYFPRDFHLYINEDPSLINVIYNYNNGDRLIITAASKILGNKIQIKLGSDTSSTVKLKYIEISIDGIKNPNRIITSSEILNKNKHTGYFKIVCLNKPDLSSFKYYYTTGINSNTYRSDYISDDNIRRNEYNWYRGNLIETDLINKNKFIIDALYNENTYNFIFLQPGRYNKIHFVTSLDDENNSNFYLNPKSTSIYFDPSSKVKTLDEIYILPSLYGEPYELYIGVSCSTNEGIYVVSPIISNTEDYIDSPSIIVNVRQIEKAKVEFNQEDIGISPLNAKARVYYYLSEINVDDLLIKWNKNFGSISNKNVDIDDIIIPGKTYTNKEKKITDVFTTITVKLNSGMPESSGLSFYFKSSNNINRCYEIYPETLIIKELHYINYLNFDSSPNYRLANDLNIKNSQNDHSLLSNEIKFEFSPPILQISFISCELYCQNKSPDSENKLLFLNYDSMNSYINLVGQNHFRKYSNNYFSNSLSTASLIFSNVIKGYQYNVQCVYQTTHSDLNSIKYKSYILSSNDLHSSYPPTTRCNTFYFISPINKEIQLKYINYCQYIMGQSLGYSSGGCVICSDPSGKIISPGYYLYFPFNCQNEMCYDIYNSTLIDEMYTLSEEFNSNSKTSKYEFTICATSNRICSSEISEETFNIAFNKFVNNIKETENVNEIFNIDYTNINYIIYNGFYQNMIFLEDNLNEDDINIEFISELNKTGNAIWKAYYNSQVNFNILCFWRIKISTYQIPTLEEMTNCNEDESFCGVFIANYGGHEYQIPDNKRTNIVTGEYTLYITCSHFVPSPLYFTSIKSIITMTIKEESFSKELINIKYINILLFLILFL